MGWIGIVHFQCRSERFLRRGTIIAATNASQVVKILTPTENNRDDRSYAFQCPLCKHPGSEGSLKKEALSIFEGGDIASQGSLEKKTKRWGKEASFGF